MISRARWKHSGRRTKVTILQYSSRSSCLDFSESSGTATTSTPTYGRHDPPGRGALRVSPPCADPGSTTVSGVVFLWVEMPLVVSAHLPLVAGLRLYQFSFRHLREPPKSKWRGPQGSSRVPPGPQVMNANVIRWRGSICKGQNRVSQVLLYAGSFVLIAVSMCMG
jgi:hypothetical protein